MSVGPIVFVGGRFVPAREARVSALDRGLLYGDGLFETVRIYRGRPFALDEHLARLRAGAERVQLRIPWPDARWRRTIDDLLRRNRWQTRDAAVRITVTRGLGPDLVPPLRTHPTVLLVARSIPAELPIWQRGGVPVSLLPFHPGLGGLLSGCKTTDYLTAVIGKRLARERGAFEGIYQTAAGEILEGTTSNVFVVRAGAIATPPLSRGILAGITRDRVLALAREEGLAVQERRVLKADLVSADEAFLTASTIEIVPIRSINGKRLGLRGPITQKLQELYRSARRHDLATA